MRDVTVTGTINVRDIYTYTYILDALSRGTHADSLHLAMRVRGREGARFFYQTRKPSVRARGGIEGYSRLTFFHAVLLRRRNRINQRDREPSDIVKVRLDRDGRAH